MTYEELKRIALTKSNRAMYVMVRKSVSQILKDAGVNISDIGRFLNKDHSTIIYYTSVFAYDLQQVELARRVYIKCKQHTDRLIDEVENYMMEI